jgi:hypothetical protein
LRPTLPPIGVCCLNRWCGALVFIPLAPINQATLALGNQATLAPCNQFTLAPCNEVTLVASLNNNIYCSFGQY